MSTVQPSPTSASAPASASYCNVCGGPLSSMHLRRASMAAEGDDIHWCHLDECDCRDYFEVDEEFDDPGGMDPAYHSSDCATQIGYVSWDLPEKDVLWLDEIRLIGASKENQKPYPISKREKSVFLTNIGKYTHAHGLRFESVASTFPSPGKDGFLVHDSCYRMLRLVASLDNKPLPLRDLYLTMKACPKDAIADVIDWKDPRSYGGAEMWAHADGWRAQASHEWLVMDPFVELSAPLFLDYASQSSVVKEGSPTWGPATARPRRTAGDNPILTTLPLEIRQMIIEYLPSSSVLNLAIASPAFHAAIRHLPNSFWKSRLQHDYRWLRCQGSRGYFGDLDLHRKSRLRLNFYALLMALDYHSRPLPNGKLVKDDKPTFFGFKNYRRIWNCAEAILSRVEARIAKSLVNHAMRVQQVDFVKYLRVVNTVYISLEKQIFSVTGFYQQGAHKKHGDGEQRQFGGLLFEFADHSTQYAGDARLYESERVSGQDIVKHSIFFDVLGKEVITDTATFWFGTSDGSGYQVVHFSTSNVHEVTLGAAHRQWHDKMSSCPSKKGGLSAIIDEAGKVRTIERPGIQIATQSMVENRKARRRQSQKEKRIVGLDVKFRKGPEGNLILCGIERVAGW